MSDTPIPPAPDQPRNEVEPEDQTSNLTARLKALGEGGEALLAILGRLLETLEHAGKPELIAGSIGFIFQGKSLGLKSEFGCIASEFGNDLILKGLSATMSENRNEQKRARSKTSTGLDIAALMADLRKGASRQDERSGIPRFVDNLGTCDDPECPTCNAVRALTGGNGASGPVAPPSPEAEG